MPLDRMTEREVFPHLVPVPATMTGTHQITGLLEVRDDALHRALRDPDPLRDVSHPDFRLLYDAQKNVRMVGEKRPFRLRLSRGASARLARARGRLAAHAGSSHTAYRVRAGRGVRVLGAGPGGPSSFRADVRVDCPCGRTIIRDSEYATRMSLVNPSLRGTR
jgi:hypothetical protein